MPESTMAYDHIYFGLQQLITHEQLSLLFERDSGYQQDIKKLRDTIKRKYNYIEIYKNQWNTVFVQSTLGS
ncbi:MAG: hypothetical protein ACO3R2_16630 [bacterium]